MKKLLLIIGIASIIICILFLLAAVLSRVGYFHVLDGSTALYSRLHQRMIVFSVIGIAFAAIGTACIIIQFKI